MVSFSLYLIQPSSNWRSFRTITINISVLTFRSIKDTFSKCWKLAIVADQNAHQTLNLATHQLMANSMANTAAQLQYNQDQAREVQRRTGSSSSVGNRNTGMNTGRDRGSISVSSSASSSSASGDGSQGVSSWASVSQQSSGNRRQQQNTNTGRVSDGTSSSSGASQVDRNSNRGIRGTRPTRRSLWTTTSSRN